MLENIFVRVLALLGCISKQKVYLFASEKRTQELVKLNNTVRIVPYRLCGCGGNAECEHCRGRGTLPGLKNGMLIAHKYDEKSGELLAEGTKIHLAHTVRKISSAAGMTKFISNAKEVDLKEMPSDKEGKRWDRYMVSVPTNISKRERIALIACFLCHVRDTGSSYIADGSKGGQVIIATLDAWREIYPNIEAGDLLKKVGYYAGNYLFRNISSDQVVRVHVLEDEKKRNGVMELCCDITIDGVNYPAVAIRDFESGTKKGTLRSISPSQLEWNHIYSKVKSRVDGFTTDEMIKAVIANGLEGSKVVEQGKGWYILEMNIKDLLVVAPPIRRGTPRIGLTLWNYGKAGLGMAEWILAQPKLNKAIKMLKAALAGDYDAESFVLGTCTPDPQNGAQVPGTAFAIPSINDEGKVKWSNPKGERTFEKIFDRFLSFYKSACLAPETPGLKELVQTTSILDDAFDEAHRKWAKKNNQPEKLFAFFPDEKINTAPGKVHILELLLDATIGFVVKKDPANSLVRFQPCVPVLDKELEHFLSTGEYLPLGGNPVLIGAGAISLPSSKTDRSGCDDFDGDKVSIHPMPVDKLPVLSPIVNWLKEFDEAVPKTVVNISTDRQILSYYHDLAITKFAAQSGVIGPMVNGSTAAAFSTIATAIMDKRKITDKKWFTWQKEWLAVAEFYAIRVQKTMLDSKKKYRDFMECADRSLELRKEGYDRALKTDDGKVSDEIKALEGLYMGFTSMGPAEISYENQEGEIKSYKSDRAYDILSEMVSVSTFASEELAFVEPYFPVISIVKQFTDVVVQDEPSQWITIEQNAPFYELTCDSQKQHEIFKRALGCILSRAGYTFDDVDPHKTVVRVWVNRIRKAYQEAYERYGTEDSLEKSEFLHKELSEAHTCLGRLNFVTPMEDKPWILGDVHDKDMALLFSLLVGMIDSEPRLNARNEYEEGSMTCFNKCPKVGIVKALHAYYAAIGTFTVNDLTGNGDETRLDATEGYKLPLWYEGGTEFANFIEWVEVDNEYEEDSMVSFKCPKTGELKAIYPLDGFNPNPQHEEE